MRKNYHQVRKQRELARKVRQQEKQQRRAVRQNAAEPAADGGATPGDPVPASDATVPEAS